MAFHTEHADSPTAQGASLWCCVVWITSDMGRRRRETDFRQLNRWECSCCQAGTPMNGWRGEGGRGQSSAALLHLERQSQKWQSDVIAIVTHKPALFILSTSRVTRRGEREAMQRGRKEERVYLEDISLHLHLHHHRAPLAVLDIKSIL